ncbi:polymer-forming cytoskeletal protein [Rhizobacter sp. Root1221]|uniref:bactofilin family protein n=1 Tax=Rhizobacter sp. Root1221 TaxID=1736433 RepID=UPI000AD51BCA|nr:polymer-forming cytoskeletal protein [Rhizobacter sp. Root1221]
MKFHLDLDLEPGRVPDSPHPDPDYRLRNAPHGEEVAPIQGGPVAHVRVPVLHAAVRPPVARPPPPEPAWFTASQADGPTLVVPVGARVRGHCQAQHVWVLGEVDGHVCATSGTLVVAAGARVRGGVMGAAAVVIAGRVQGRRGRPAVVAHGRLDIACSAHITGTVVHGVVALYEGARVEGDLLPVAQGWDRSGTE